MEKELSNIIVDDKIFIIRGIQVMIDRDLADLYQVETKRLNEQVKRNIKKFPNDFMFQLMDEEKNELVAKCDRLEKLKHST
ncbi:ORF6N domain-containing protein [Arcobacter nitrofigilis]|nr:ORF6N domain-containing protein [Arcobacter nitrofigilis]